MAKSGEANTSWHEMFQASLRVAHYYATRSAALAHKSLESVACKLATSLLRHTDMIPADKAFLEAGTFCKVRTKGEKGTRKTKKENKKISIALVTSLLRTVTTQPE